MVKRNVERKRTKSTSSAAQQRKGPVSAQHSTRPTARTSKKGVVAKSLSGGGAATIEKTSRAPVRRIVGQGAEKTPDSQRGRATSGASAPAPSASEKSVLQPPWPVTGWNQLPREFPATVQAFLSLAEHECRRASEWPLSFARVMERLPGALSGVEMALLTLSLEQSPAELGRILEREVGFVESAVEQAGEKLRLEFSQACATMSRQWAAVLGGAGVDERSLIERYLVEGLDAAFQKFLGRLLLRALGARNPIVDNRPQRDRWSTNPRLLSASSLAL